MTLMSARLSKIKPHRWGWKVLEAPGVEPVCSEKDQAINYAEGRACFRAGEVRILDSRGILNRPFRSASLNEMMRSTLPLESEILKMLFRFYSTWKLTLR